MRFIINNQHFDIKNDILFKKIVDINIWANNIDIQSQSKKRLNQEKFRNQIVKRDKKCIVTGKNVPKEYDACHIVQIKDDENYDVNNRLLINKSINAYFI